MKIAAIQSVYTVRPTDSGNTVVIELIDGAEDRWTVLIPTAVARDLMPMLEKADEDAAAVRHALGRS